LTGFDTESAQELLPGIIYCIVIAALSYGTWFFYKPISTLMWAFIYSIVITNLIGTPQTCTLGARFASSRLLRVTIGLLGLVTSALIWLEVGVGIVNALVVIFVSFGVSLWLGEKVGISRRLSILIGVGTSICGASAIAAISPAIGAEEEEIGLAIAGITLFGLTSMFLYPFLFMNTPINDLLLGNLNVYAIWVGSGVHETAQVLGAAGALGSEVIQPAMMIKSIRIFMIGPVVLIANYVYNNYRSEKKAAKVVLPWFGVAFIVNTVVCALLDSYVSGMTVLGFSWPILKTFLKGRVIPFLLAVAFAGVGCKVRFESIASLGLKPFIVAAIIAVSAGIVALALAALVAPMVPTF